MISREVLDRYVDEGWLISQVHPTLPLTIYNYSQKTQYEGKWDEVTLQCRGLVMDHNGDLVARPFRKFFNLEEGKHAPTEQFEIYEKLDGSLGIFFYYQGEPVFASRGSFTSEQAVKGRELLDKYNWQNSTYEGYTYLFEILYPANRIVVNYGELSELIVIGVINTDIGEEVAFDWMEADGFKLVKKYDFKDYREIQKLNWENSEGFVVRFSNGDRCKIKFADYVKLHKVLTNCSSYDVWENLMTFGKLPEEMLKDVPDEFYDWVHGMERSLWDRYHQVESLYTDLVAGIAEYSTDQKDFALRVMSLDDVNHGLMFAIYKSNIEKARQLIWKMIKPEYEKPFNT